MCLGLLLSSQSIGGEKRYTGEWILEILYIMMSVRETVPKISWYCRERVARYSQEIIANLVKDSQFVLSSSREIISWYTWNRLATTRRPFGDCEVVKKMSRELTNQLESPSRQFCERRECGQLSCDILENFLQPHHKLVVSEKRLRLILDLLSVIFIARDWHTQVCVWMPKSHH